MKKSIYSTIFLFLILCSFAYAQGQGNGVDDRIVNYVEQVNKVNRITNQPTMEVHGTEYTIFDEAKAFLQLTEGSYYVNNATCFISIYYPNMTYMLSDQLMFRDLDGEGIYYYDLIIPNVTGVFPFYAECIYSSTQNDTHSSSSVINNGVLEAGTLSNTNTSNNVYYRIGETGATNDNLIVTFNYSGITFPKNPLTELSYVFDIESYVDSDADDITLFYVDIFNFTSSSFTNQITSTKTDLLETINSKTFSNSTRADFIKNGIFSARVQAISTNNATDNLKDIFIDHAEFSVIFGSVFPVTNLRGSGELHVTRYNYETAQKTSQILANIENIILNLTNIATKTDITNAENSINQNVYTANNSIHLKLDLLNTSLIQQLTNFSGTINASIIMSLAEEQFSLDIATCPLSTKTGSFAMFVLFAVAIALMILGIRSLRYVESSLGALMIFILGIYIFRCNEVIAGCIVGFAIIMLYQFNSARKKKK